MRFQLKATKIKCNCLSLIEHLNALIIVHNSNEINISLFLHSIEIRAGTQNIYTYFLWSDIRLPVEHERMLNIERYLNIVLHYLSYFISFVAFVMDLLND